MSLSDKIQIASIIVALVLGLISIGITIYSQIQNNKMIEESTRPYISIYLAQTQTSAPQIRLILKNSGNSPAKIISINSNQELLKEISFDNREIFSDLNNVTIYPGQKIITSINSLEITDNHVAIPFKIAYESTKKYEQTIIINFKMLHNIVLTRSSSYNDEKALKTISYTLQDMNEKLL